VDKSRLPAVSKAKLKAGQYVSTEALSGAIVAETAYVKALTGSGRPFAQGASAPAKKAHMTPDEDAARYAEIAKRHGL
jgi:hypothetical protein